MLPPRPPSPPSGPPRGIDRSRRNEAEPSPPLPAITSIFASSKNFMGGKEKAPCEDGALSRCEEPSGLHRLDRDHALLLRAVLVVLDLAGHEREEGVVLADADVRARMKLGAALAHEDRARVDELAAVDLDAEPLGLGIAAVA